MSAKSALPGAFDTNFELILDGWDFADLAAHVRSLAGSASGPFAESGGGTTALSGSIFRPAGLGSGAAASGGTEAGGTDWGQLAAYGLAANQSGGHLGGGAQITVIDLTALAKGGNSGGGGGSGGGGDSGVLKEYRSGSADGDLGYDIWIEFKGTWTAALQTAFIQAADYFTTVITADIGGNGLYRGKLIDDLYVTAELKAIDGVGGILGQAGPTAVWTATELTAAGQMQFDIADALTYYDLGLWDDIVTHELMHVLGFGSLWNYGKNPLVFNGNEYRGQHGLDAYRDAIGDPDALYIPVETDGGSGTAGAHWDDELLKNELMTGYINNDGDPATDTDNYLSKFSVMSLADLGYQIGYQDYPYDGVPAIA